MSAAATLPVTLPISDGTELSVLDLGVEFPYVVPSFSVLEVFLRQATLQVESMDGSVHLYDGFLRSYPGLNTANTPFCLTLTRHCFVSVEEFCKVVYVRHLRAVPDCGIVIVWNWSVNRGDSDFDGEQSDASDDEPSVHSPVLSDDPNEQSEQDGDQSIEESCVAFKCIGVTRDSLYQTVLQQVKYRMKDGETVQVKLKPEPDNPYDTRAIAFQCLHQDTWQTIGYVVIEACEEVHTAIEERKIISVEFAWVKYKLWKRSTGYYTAINITRKGEWSPTVRKCCSTFY